MNTYRAVELPDGRWGVEWLADGIAMGLVGEPHAERTDALGAVLELALKERREHG